MTDLQSISDFLQAWWAELLSGVLLAAAVPLVAAYAVVAERNFLANMDGPKVRSQSALDGPAQTTLGAMNLLLHEILPSAPVGNFIFRAAPFISLAVPLFALGAIAFGPNLQVARDINIGLLFIFGVSSRSVFGLILRARGSHNSTSILTAMHAAVQLIIYQVGAALALISGAVLAATIRIRAIVDFQQQHAAWFIFLSPIAFLIYVTASLDETSRAPLDFQAADSKNAAINRGDPSGPRFSLVFLAEYVNRIVVGSIAVTLFLGGWLRPFPNVRWLNWLDAVPPLMMVLAAVHITRGAGKQPNRAQQILVGSFALMCFAAAILLAAPLVVAKLRFMQPGIHGAFWFLFKLTIFLFFFTVLRFAVPPFSFLERTHFAWRFLIPLSLANVFAVAIALLLESEYHWNRWLAILLTTLLTLGVARFQI